MILQCAYVRMSWQRGLVKQIRDVLLERSQRTSQTGGGLRLCTQIVQAQKACGR